MRSFIRVRVRSSLDPLFWAMLALHRRSFCLTFFSNRLVCGSCMSHMFFLFFLCVFFHIIHVVLSKNDLSTLTLCCMGVTIKILNFKCTTAAQALVSKKKKKKSRYYSRIKHAVWTESTAGQILTVQLRVGPQWPQASLFICKGQWCLCSVKMSVYLKCCLNHCVLRPPKCVCMDTDKVWTAAEKMNPLKHKRKTLHRLTFLSLISETIS